MANIEVIEFDAPACWASAMINGDETGLSDEEQEEFQSWCNDNPNLHVVDCGVETFYRDWNGIQTELVEYSAHVRAVESMMKDHRTE